MRLLMCNGYVCPPGAKFNWRLGVLLCKAAHEIPPVSAGIVRGCVLAREVQLRGR